MPTFFFFALFFFFVIQKNARLGARSAPFTMVVYGSIVDSHLAVHYTLLTALILRRVIRYYCLHHFAVAA